MLCDYGCKQEGKYIMTTGKICCSERYNSCPAIRKKNSEGLERAHAENRMPIIKGTVPHNKGKTIPVELVKVNFTLNGKGPHKRILIHERGHKCESCNNTEWLNEPIPLELEHIDGNNRNQIRENLLLLCPNCHAKTPTYRGRNARRDTPQKVIDADLIIALQTSLNIREALLKVGLVGKGGNYVRCKKLIKSGIQLKEKEINLNKKNSQYGKIWVCHLDNKDNKSIRSTELQSYIDLGWLKGRVIKFGQVAQLVETR